jgi:hypothetical protein
MKNLRIPLVALLGLALASWFGVASDAAAIASGQTQSTALERGYRTGYSDGYNAGYRDEADKAPRAYQNKDEYQRADRSYNEAWGTLETYRSGYQQGFEAGYTAGYDRQPFNSAIPSGLARRNPQDSAPQINTQGASQPNDSPADTSSSSSSPSTINASLSIPSGAIFTIELDNSLSTDASQPGDRFRARVMDPGEYAGAIIEGRITRVKRPGKVKGVAELQLAFDQIRTRDNRGANFSAEVIEVIDSSGDGGSVDSEGGVKGKDSTKDDVAKVGAATGIGAIVGAIIGGGKGAAIGATVGGAAGAGRVLTKRGQDIRLDRGQQLRIRTSGETRL